MLCFEGRIREAPLVSLCEKQRVPSPLWYGHLLSYKLGSGCTSANHISEYVLLGQDDVGQASVWFLSWDVDFLWLCVVVSILLTWEKRGRKLLTSHGFVANTQ